MKQLRAKFRTFTRFRFIYIAKHLSLILGLVFTLLIISYVYQELQTDRFHSKAENIHVLVEKYTPLSNWGGTTLHWQKQIDKIQKAPGIKQYTNIRKYWNKDVRITHDQHTFQSNCFVVQNNFFEFFDFGFARGNVDMFKENPQGVILTRELARKMFGDENPIGKSFEILIENKQLFTVCGVLEGIPVNSSMDFEFIVSEKSYKRYSRMGVGFLLTNKDFKREKFNQKFKHLTRNKYQKDEAILSTIPFKNAYFKGDDYYFIGVLKNNGNYRRLRILAGIAAILFLVSLVNYSNIQSTLYSSESAKISIYRIFGAKRKHLIWQKIPLIFLEYCLQVLVVALLFHAFTKALVEHNILIEEQYIYYLVFIPAGVLLFYLLTMVYPAIKIFTLSKDPVIRNVDVVRGNYSTRRAFVLMQYTFTIALILSSIFVYKQYQAMLNKDIGIKTSTIMRTQFFTALPGFESKEERIRHKNKRRENFQMIQDKLRQIPGVKSFARGDVPFESFKMSMKSANDKMEYTTQNVLIVCPGYEETLGIDVKEGRFFSEEKDRSRGNHVVINEAAREFWGIDDIKDDRIMNKSWNDEEGDKIIGVVENFNYEHLASKVKPLVFYYFNDKKRPFLIEIEKSAIPQTISKIRELYASLNPEEVFDYSFLSGNLKAMYTKEKKLGQAYGLLTLIAIFISSLGLIALAIEDINKRTKEIGIRKVNGAKVPQILILLNTDFLRWVAIAFVIACPVAWYAMHRWLQNFAYKTGLSWWVFALAGVIALAIALLTVSWQSWRAARRNPVESLISE